MMEILSVITGIWLAITGVFSGGLEQAGANPFVFTSDQVGSSAADGFVLQTDGDVSTWVATSTLGLGGGGGSGTVTSVAQTVPTGLTVSGSPITTSGTLAISYDTGYAAVLTASTTNWNDFYDTPSDRITAGTGLSWSTNTLNAEVETADLHDAVTLAGTPNYLTLSGQEITLTVLDISDDTNLGGTWPVIISGDNVTWGGLATTSNPTAGDIFYSDGTNGLIPIATSSVNVGTATALEANGSNCSAGSYALGVDAAGASEGCTDATTEIDSAISTHAGDDNAHQELVSLAGALDYITIVGQTITRNALDLAADITGVLPIANGGTGASTLNNLITLTTHTTGNYVASITNGAGITGGDGGSEGAGLTLAATLGTDIVTGEIVDGTILANDISTTTTFLDGEIVSYVAATDNFTSVTCAEITGSADLCDGSDDGGGGSAFGQAWEIAGGFLAPTTTTPVSTGQASSTLFSGLQAWFGGTATTSIDTAGNVTLGGTITVGGDSINEFAGTGLTVSGNALTADLGTAIVTGEITNGTILELDLDTDVIAVDGDFLQYDSTGTNFTWRSASETLSDIGAEGDLSNEAGLYAALSDVTQFWEAGDTINSGTLALGSLSFTGTLPHENGGLELDVSGIGIGDIIAGVSAGTVEIVDGGSASDGHVLTIQADGTVEWEAAAGGGSSKWTDGGLSTYLTATSDDLHLGATATATAAFWWDVSESTNYIGSGGAGDSVIELLIDSVDKWIFGADDSDNDNFVLSSGGTLGTNNVLVASSTDPVDFPKGAGKKGFFFAHSSAEIAGSVTYAVLDNDTVVKMDTDFYSESAGTVTIQQDGYYQVTIRCVMDLDSGTREFGECAVSDGGTELEFSKCTMYARETGGIAGTSCQSSIVHFFSNGDTVALEGEVDTTNVDWGGDNTNPTSMMIEFISKD